MPTKIEWTDETWNPVTGCTPVSEGCKNCYAKTMTVRFGDRPFSKIRCREARLGIPRRWRKPRRIFVCSMGDLFHGAVPWEFIDKILMGVVHECKKHTFMILTKRPERMKEYMDDVAVRHSIPDWFPNLWMGVTAENQKAADERIPILLQIPAAVHFVSVEPMLEAMDLSSFLRECGGGYFPVGLPKQQPALPDNWRQPPLDWVICGAETGPRARAMEPDWARNLRDQCNAAKVPFFMKQVSGKMPIPKDLRIREWPK